MIIHLAQINPIVGDLKGNTEKIISTIRASKKEGADLVVFPECALTGYPPEDLLLLPHFIEETAFQLQLILSETKGTGAIIGYPRKNPHTGEKTLFNSAAIMMDGTLLGVQDKILLPTYDVFNERRYFESGTEVKLWDIGGKKIGITVCEDIWHHTEAVPQTSYQKDPVLLYRDLKPDLMINISSSPYSVNKPSIRFDVCSKAAQSLRCPLLLCNQVGANDSLIFDGHSLYCNRQGELLASAEGFKEEVLVVDLSKEYTPFPWTIKTEENLFQALVLGIRDYFLKQGFKSCCFGLSGGIDSAVVACIATEALGKENVTALCMPSRYSSEASTHDAKVLTENLDIRNIWVSIESPFQSFLDLLEPHFEGKPPDTTEENLQARTRGIILMAFSNKYGHVVLSTGNKSEMAMGYATLYGDMCGGLGVLNDVTKRQVYELAEWINRDKKIIPQNILDKPPSAELKPNQKDSDSLPEYAIVDAVLEDYIVNHLSPQQIAEKHGYSLELVEDLVKKIHINEYKRRQSPPGLRVSERAFSKGRQFPIVQKWV
ncbi:MAG: Glutamine-dependent NAD(+) synthetase [Chlamydiae bacterium]|nr:Glutamine-dependent NAD(+) synthetase [Chlamydiota bacterium]